MTAPHPPFKPDTAQPPIPFKTGDKILFRRILGETASTRRVRLYLGTLGEADTSHHRRLDVPDHWWVHYGRGHRRSVPLTDIKHFDPGATARVWTEPKALAGHG